tara:strand:- start:223 stop:714 length:492 start_codon:yes stop_codon:yes gene_type:complete
LPGRSTRLDIPCQYIRGHRNKDVILCSAQVFRSAFAGPAVSNDVKGQLLAFGDRAHSRAFDSGNMDEYVRATAISLNEAKTLGAVEEFYCASAHDDFLSINQRECPDGLDGRNRAIKSMLMGKSPERYAQNKVRQTRSMNVICASFLFKSRLDFSFSEEKSKI